MELTKEAIQQIPVVRIALLIASSLLPSPILAKSTALTDSAELLSSRVRFSKSMAKIVLCMGNPGMAECQQQLRMETCIKALKMPLLHLRRLTNKLGRVFQLNWEQRPLLIGLRRRRMLKRERVGLREGSAGMVEIARMTVARRCRGVH